MAAAVGRMRQNPGEPVHAYLARSWSTPKAADLIRRALVLLANHELNVSTFAAHVTASPGANALPADSGELPGFGHPLYAGLDARAGALLASFKELQAHARARARIADRYGLALNIDYALSALAVRFQLPLNAPLIIVAVASAIGWMAHAMEQVEEGALI